MIRKLAVLSGASSALFATPARAQTSDGWIPGVGIFLGVAFGTKTSFAWGIETFATYRFAGAGCSNALRSGAGPLVQVAVGDRSQPRITVALQGGGEISQASATALTGELGATYRFGDRRGFGIHTGITPEFLIFNASFRAQWLLEDYSVTGGARFLATYGGPGYCIEGRPLRTSSGLADVCSTTLRHGVPPSHARRTDDAAFLAGLGWESAARYECASVPAFLQLAAELLAHDAPDALVERALAAAQDEMRHAELCADLASRYLGARIWPTLPDVLPRPPLAGMAGLVRLATESWLDGCLAEGVAAKRAERASLLATDLSAQGAQRAIAHDEARHAELGWSILQWATESGGDEVRDEVRLLRAAEIAGGTGEGDAAERYGRLGPSHVDEVTERHCARSRDRLDALL